MERGVITSAVATKATKDGYIIRYMSPEILRYYALYWDKILLTDSRLLRINPSPEMSLLESAGVLSRERAHFHVYGLGPMPGQESVNVHHAATATIANRLCHEYPGQWTIHQESSALILPPEMSVKKATAEIQLLNCLPIPKADVPLNKILDFKMRRESELAALRIALDEMYLSVISSADIARATNLETVNLEKAINDLSCVAGEHWSTGILGSRRVYLELSAEAFLEGAKYATAGALSAGSVGGLIGGVTGTLVSSIRVELNHSEQLNIPTGKQSELSYLSSLTAENIVEKP